MSGEDNMKIAITPNLLSGKLTPPPSKSMAHRLLVCAALARGRSVLSNISFSDDVKATLACMKSIGATWKMLDSSTVEVIGTSEHSGDAAPTFECGESGSTLRFFIPIALALCGGGRFSGKGRLMKRPLGLYFDLFMEKGIAFSYSGDALSVCGKLPSGRYSLRGDVSSQFFSGLLFALPILAGDSEIRATTKLESVPYVEMTLAAQSKAGVEILREEGYYKISGGSAYSSFNATVEADWSQAAFWVMANLLGSAIELCGLDENSSQGDRAHTAAIAGAMKNFAEKELSVDLADCPDLLPPASAAAALCGAGRTTRFYNASRLRLKESDRLSSVADVLTALGARVEVGRDSMTIFGADSLRGGVEISCHNDHRIAMMAAIAATRCENAVVLNGAECVKKSYPNFWEDYRRLGGKIEEI